MDYLLHRIRVAVLAAMVLGLLLYAALPARATQTDYAALESRMATMESTLAGLAEIANRYRLTEAELALHLSSARQAEAKAVPKTRKIIQTLTRLLGSTYLPGTEKTLAFLKRKIGELEDALADWNNAVRRARQLQDEICSQAKRLNSSPEPSSEQIAEWRESGQQRLETVTGDVRAGRTAITAAWDALSDSVRTLEVQSNRLETFLSRRDEYESNYRRLFELGAKFTMVKKDYDKAHELSKKLKALRMSFHLVHVDTLSEDLKKMRQTAASLTTGAPGADMSSMNDRINAALTKLNRLYLPRTIPTVGGPDPLTKSLIKQYSQIYTSGLRENFDKAATVVPSCRSALAGAHDTLKRASSSQAGFGGLQVGRQCLADLQRGEIGDNVKEEPDYLVGELQSRLEKAERLEHVFTTRNRENTEINRQLSLSVAEADEILRFSLHVERELERRLNTPRPDAAIESLNRLLTDLGRCTDEFAQAAEALAKAGQKAEQRQQEICTQTANASSRPLLSDDEIRNRRRESENDLNRIRQEIEQAAQSVRTQSAATKEQIRKAAAGRDALRKVKDTLIAVRKAQAEQVVELSRALDIWKQAIRSMQQVAAECKALENLKQEGLEEMAQIQEIATDLGPRLADPAVTATLTVIRKRAAGLATRYQKVVVIRKPDPASPYTTTDQWLQRAVAVSNAMKRMTNAGAGTEKSLIRIRKIVKRADDALAGAGIATETADRDYAVAREVITRAESCLSSMENVIVDTTRDLDTVRQLISECNYTQAEILLKGIKPGPVKDQLARELAEGRTLERELSSLVDQASELYKKCRLNKALKILNQALGMARCQDHIKSINRKIELAKKKLAYEKNIIALYEEADKLYGEQKYEDALARLLKARERTTCQRFRDSLGEKIAKVRAGIAAADEEDEQPSPSSSCAGLTKQLKDQAEEIRKRLKDYASVADTQPRPPRSQSGPVACRVVEAEKQFHDLWMEAKNADCTEATKIQSPGAMSAAHGLACHRWRQEQGSRQADCQVYRDRLARTAEEEDRLTEQYRELEKARRPVDQMRPVACAVLKKIEEFSRILGEAVDNGCACCVEGRSRWLPSSLRQVCGSGFQEDPAQKCDKYYREIKQFAKANEALSMELHRLANGGESSEDAVKGLACQLAANFERMSRAIDAAREAGCTVSAQVSEQTLQSYRSICGNQ